MALAVHETLWAQQLLTEMEVQVLYPTVLHEDNKPAIYIATNQKNPKLAKHLDTKLRAIEDYIVKGYIQVRHVETRNQLADVLTKVISRPMDLDALLGPNSTLGEVKGVC